MGAQAVVSNVRFIGASSGCRETLRHLLQDAMLNVDPAVYDGEPPPADVVQQVKDLQRGDTEAKEQWIAFTDANGSGRRDPSKHPATFLREFLELFASGKRLAVHQDAEHVLDLIR